MLTTAELSRLSGFSASALRYYEARGLIASAGRKGMQRLFEPSVASRLTLIALGRSAGFSLAEIAAMLGRTDAPRIDRARLLDKADEVDRTIRGLQRLRDGLRHVAACRAQSHLDCPRFQRIMRAGVERAARPSSRTGRTPCTERPRSPG